MRVLFLTYDHPLRGRSGVAAYCRDLLRALQGRGVEVVHLYSCDRGWTVGPRLRQWTEEGVRFAALVNSPAPPALSLDRPLQDCGHPGLDRLFAAFLREVQPDVVHVHTLMGFTGSLVRVAKGLGVPVVASLHDFWPLCAQVSLVRRDGMACTGPEGGVNCARFCAGKDGLRRRAHRRLVALLPPGPMRRAVEGAAALYLRARPRSPQPVQGPSHHLPRAQHAWAHGERARRLLQDLLTADRLLAVSRFVQEVYARHGIPHDRMTVLPLGLAVPDQVRWRVRTARRPVRFGYLGRLSPFKGAHLLARAARDVPPQRARFLFFGPGSPAVRAELEQLAGGRPLEFYGAYRREDLPRVLEEIDVAVVPTLFQETVGLTALEPQAAGVPVIASAAGALPEWIGHGHNGLLFPPGDVTALRRLILQVVDDPGLVLRLSANTRPPRSMAEHAAELLRVYEACREVCRV